MSSIDYRHYEIAPNTFRVGDVVKAQISFEIIWLRGQCQKMIIILRALTLLDKGALEVSKSDGLKNLPLKKTQQNAINLRAKARTNNLWRPTTLKRKIGYHDESEDDEDMPEIARMKIDHKVV